MKLPIKLHEDSREPIYHQIENQLKALITSGQLAADSTLPSIRKLSKDMNISIITTRRAYQNLEQQNYITTIQGKGTFVKAVTKQEREQVKKITVERALNLAIDIALQHEYSSVEVTQIFKRLLDERKGNE